MHVHRHQWQGDQDVAIYQFCHQFPKRVEDLLTEMVKERLRG